MSIFPLRGKSYRISEYPIIIQIVKYGSIYIKIDQWFPSSKICNNCKEKNDNLTLNDREWECPQCASKLDRDINAAKNILNEGMKYLLNNRKGCQSAGTVDYTNGADVRPIITNWQTAVKLEARSAC